MSVDRSQLSGAKITAILGKDMQTMRDGSTSIEELLFRTDVGTLRCGVNVDHDTLELSWEPATYSADGFVRVDVLHEFVGAVFGWSWFAHNSQGYGDFLAIAFGEAIEQGALTPQLALLTEGSSISLLRLHSI